VLPLFFFLLLGGIAIATHGVRDAFSEARLPMHMIGATGRRRRRLAALRKKPWHELSESERLELLTPDTQKVAVEIVSQLRARGLDARLGETYRDEHAQREKFEEGKSSIREPGWHTMGRAFHVIIIDPKSKKVQEKAYPLAGQIAASLGVEWKGDRILKNKFGQDYRDLAHFEYHPTMTLAEARKAAGYA
jgi:hypothetical protein